MDKSSLTGLERLKEQIQESFNKVLQARVIMASNSIEIYTLFEHIRVTLMQSENYDPNLVRFVMNTAENELINPTMETLAQEIDELNTELDEFI